MGATTSITFVGTVNSPKRHRMSNVRGGQNEFGIGRRTLRLEVPPRDGIEGVRRQAKRRPTEVDAREVGDLWVLPEKEK